MKKTLKDKRDRLERKHNVLKRKAAYLKWEGTPNGAGTIQSFFDYDNIKGGDRHREAEGIFNELTIILNEIKIIEEEIKRAEFEINTAIQSAKESSMPIEDKIFYLKQVVGYSLEEIAETLGYSYDYVRHIAG